MLTASPLDSPTLPALTDAAQSVATPAWEPCNCPLDGAGSDLSPPSHKPVLQALNLTCNVWGDPTPEVSWLKNEKPLASDEHCSLRFEAGKTAFFTISGVSTADSGKYGLVVKNKYGSEISDFTVSVFIPEEEARKGASEPQKGNQKSK